MKRSKLNLDLKSLNNQKSQTTVFKDTCTVGTFVQNQTVPGVFNQAVVNDNVSLEIPKSESNLLAILDLILVRAQLFYYI